MTLVSAMCGKEDIGVYILTAGTSFTEGSEHACGRA